MRELRDRIGSRNQVRRIAFGSHFPIGFGTSGSFVIGRETNRASPPPTARWQEVSPGYFDLLQIRVIQGRAMLETDSRASEPVAIVNEECATQYWGDRSPIGEEVRLGSKYHRIVGVVNSTKPAGLVADSEPIIYVPLSQVGSRTVILFAEVEGDPTSIIPLVARWVRELDSAVIVADSLPLSQLVSDSIAESWIQALTMGLFGTVGLLLVVAGVYGVQSFLGSQRRHEYAVRMACGATGTDILLNVLRSALFDAILGLTLGGLVFGVFAEWTRSVLYEVQSADAVSIIPPLAAILLANLSAALLPALRASRQQPLEVLRA